MIVESRSIHREGDALELDPFAFWPAYSSRLQPLGGPERSEDPDYVFHTLYVACGDGTVVFTVKVDGLTAERGTMILRLHELPDGIGSNARQIAIGQAQLLDLIRGDGVATISTEARHGYTYAALGHIYGDTVANASAISVSVERRTPDPDAPDRPSDFTTTRVATTPAIVGNVGPTLAGPASQLCTAPQFRERIYADWAVHLGGARKERSLAQWERVFIARVLDRYDMSRPGARGLAIVGGEERHLVDALSAAGCQMTLAMAPPLDGDALPYGVVAVDPRDMPDAVAGFDFVFATSDHAIAGGWKDQLAYIESMLRCLKPGGLAVLLVHATPDDNCAIPDVLGWHDIVRVALTLLSRGHQVAQLRRDVRHPFPEAGETGTERSIFGFTVRRR